MDGVLSELASRDYVARSTFDLIMKGMVNTYPEINVEELHTALSRELGNVAKSQVLSLLRVLEEQGLGELLLGRRGSKTRFRWQSDPRELLAKEGFRVEPLSACVMDDAMGPSTSSDAGSALLVAHRFRLRRGLDVELNLPEDMRPEEADRLASFVRTLPLS